MSPDDKAVQWLKMELKRWSKRDDHYPGRNAVLSILLLFEMETGVSLSD